MGYPKYLDRFKYGVQPNKEKTGFILYKDGNPIAEYSSAEACMNSVLLTARSAISEAITEKNIKNVIKAKLINLFRGRYVRNQL